MPTARGWLVAATGAALVVSSFVFGSASLLQIGFGLLVLVGAAVVVVRVGNHDVSAARTVSPQRGRPEQPVSVRLSVVNRGRGPAPLILLQDALPWELSGRARFALHGLEARGTREAVYELRAMRRGSYRIGPLDISFRDPFGLAATGAQGAPESRFLVHPRLEKLAIPRDRGERRSASVSTLRQLTGARGEDFYTLREYAEGDDLRKIHWPSTARLQKTMIRQEETPWQTRVTIVLDDRLDTRDRGGAAFERCVEAAASVIDLYHRMGYGYRLTTANSAGLQTARGAAHHGRCMDLLATVRPQVSPAAPDPLLARLSEIDAASGAEGTLVVISTALDERAAILLARCARRFRDSFVVLFPSHRRGTEPTRSRWDGERASVDLIGLLNQSGIRAVVLGPGEPLATGWTPPKGGGAWARRAGRA